MLDSSKKILTNIEMEYSEGGIVDHVDGLGVEYPDWRFNLRLSNTEPVIRLNVETLGDRKVLSRSVNELITKIR